VVKHVCAAVMLMAAWVAGTGPAHADVCGYAGGPVGGVNGCTEIGRDVEIGADVVGAAIVADAADAAAQAAAGRPPCYTRDGVPYYTPGDAPCF
jgi:hypothetical protein